MRSLFAALIALVILAKPAIAEGQDLPRLECFDRFRNIIVPNVQKIIDAGKDSLRKSIPDSQAAFKQLPPIQEIIKNKDVQNLKNAGGIAEVLLMDGYKEQAMSLYQPIAENAESILGEKSNYLAYVQGDFGLIHVSKGEFEEAQCYLIPAMKQLEKNYSHDVKNNLLAIYIFLAYIKFKQGDTSLACDYSKNWMDIAEGVRGPQLISGTALYTYEKIPTRPKEAPTKPKEEFVSIPANTPVKDKWALVIGISNFKKPGINLKYASKDAKDFYDYLVSDAGFKKDHICLLLNQDATRENIMTAFGSNFLPAVCEKGDIVVIFISTHGTPSEKDAGKQNYIVAYDTDPNNLFPTGVDMDLLYQRIKKGVDTERVLIVMDTCYSGAGIPGKALSDSANFDASSVAQGTGRLVITSSANNERSYESNNCENGVFTKHFLKALKQNKNVDVKKAFEEAQENVRWEVKSTMSKSQVPQLGGKWEGAELILAAPATKPREAYSVPFSSSTTVVSPKPGALKPGQKKY